MCSLVSHDRLQENKIDDESSIGDIEIPNDATVVRNSESGIL